MDNFNVFLVPCNVQNDSFSVTVHVSTRLFLSLSPFFFFFFRPFAMYEKFVSRKKKGKSV